MTKIYCSVAECKNKVAANGYCFKHYMRLKRNGTLTPRHIKFDDEKRFWSKVVITNKCWLWEGNKNKDGYGQFTVKGKNTQAHRYCYELLVYKITNGYQLDHLCRVHNCVNPNHLEEVTQRENIRRGWDSRGRESGLPAGVTKLPYGRFASAITIGGSTLHIGVFDTPEEANKAFLDYPI